VRDTIGSIVLIGGPLLGMALPVGRSEADTTPPTPGADDDGQDPGRPPDPPA
jgi:hypothetical protein